MAVTYEELVHALIERLSAEMELVLQALFAVGVGPERMLWTLQSNGCDYDRRLDVDGVPVWELRWAQAQDGTEGWKWKYTTRWLADVERFANAGV